MAVGFGTGHGATQAQFRQILNAGSGSTDIFKGRQVSERTGFGTNYDNCWYQVSPYIKWTAVLGSSWNVGYYAIDPPYITSLNEWADDYIGWYQEQVTWYRGHWQYDKSTPLCGARIPQAMYVGTGGSSGGKENYSADRVGEDIYPSKVTAYRAGVSQSANH